jgi:hypothetical protein
VGLSNLPPASGRMVGRNIVVLEIQGLLRTEQRLITVSLQEHFHRLVWPELVIATSKQRWAWARSVVGLSGRIGQQHQKLRYASMSRVGTHG